VCVRFNFVSCFSSEKRVCIDSRNVNYNTVVLSYQWSKPCRQETIPGDRNNILCTHCVSFTFAWGYCRLLLVLAFYVQCLTVAGVSQPSSNVAREIRISQGPKNQLVLFR